MQELPEEEYGCAKCGAEWVSGLQVNFWVLSETAVDVPLPFENPVHYKLPLIFPLSLGFTLQRQTFK